MSRSSVNTRVKTKKRTRSKSTALLMNPNSFNQLSSWSDFEESTSRAAPTPQRLSPIIESATKGISIQNTERMDVWKQVLQQYIKAFNQAETDQYARSFNDVHQDDVHHIRVSNRLERIRERELQRGIIPAGSETKGEIIHVNETEDEVSVQLKLYIKRRMEQNHLHYMEERIEHERIWLTKQDQQWIITKVEPIIMERRPRYGSVTVDWPTSQLEHEEQMAQLPVPYLNQVLIPRFKTRGNTTRYRRDLAVAYADMHWNKPSGQYEEFDSNCTNYVSQCIFAGNVPMLYTNRRDSGWWYKGKTREKEWWSYSWSVSNSLTMFLAASRKQGLRAEEKQSADELELGDIITYDWNGNSRFQHSTVVTAFDSLGQPLVNANTVSSRHRYWDYQDSYAWTPSTRYRFFHIANYI